VHDYSALIEPVSTAEVTAWRGRPPGAHSRGRPTLGYRVGNGLSALIFISVVGGVLTWFFIEGIRGGIPVYVIFSTVGFAVIAIATIGAVRGRRTSEDTAERWFRLDRFARANGMTFHRTDVAPAYPGQIFHLGRDQAMGEHLVSNGRFLDIGNISDVVGSGTSRLPRTWGFLALALDRAMPNIVLDAKKNNSLFGSDLPNRLDQKQILHLEGDFDTYFTLYCPAQYERDALYIFTPDLMALLIDEASPFDVELVDKWMFVYSARPFELTDPAVLQRLFTIADTVGAKALTQTEHYADDRVGDPAANVVAPQGARLKRVSTIGLVLVGAFAAYWGCVFVSSLFSFVR
jgi:hypothetical protein